MCKYLHIEGTYMMLPKLLDLFGMTESILAIINYLIAEDFLLPTTLVEVLSSFVPCI
ncbi:hypothetical protein VCHA35O141_90122 [Vibrio chagasii]|nr:hypothetical protein VCHA34P129_120071 [Vibrio chagasii]CAH6822256.1 hypothetical protein VCHA36P164_150034 [Vibrio chagasii]CAH6917934.1 hypothetical protein VCHA40P242_130073 [Vibrio chagasii]CAH6928994.1 hypothetical protein VCHA55P509_120009 [Vibrio chagasii]CAH6965549.1 hypothetical protein VCHA54O485_130122 [Vibrio chagasii]